MASVGKTPNSSELAVAKPLCSASLAETRQGLKSVVTTPVGNKNSTFKEVMEQQLSNQQVGDKASVKNDNSIAKFVNEFVDGWRKTEIASKEMGGKLNPRLNGLFALQQSVNRLHLRTQMIEKLAEAFSSSVKSLQKAAGG